MLRLNVAEERWRPEISGGPIVFAVMNRLCYILITLPYLAYRKLMSLFKVVAFNQSTNTLGHLFLILWSSFTEETGKGKRRFDGVKFSSKKNFP